MKIFSYMVHKRGIEINLAKFETLTKMMYPQTKKVIVGFLGRLQYISRFIS